MVFGVRPDLMVSSLWLSVVGHCFARCKARCLLLVARRRRLVAELAAAADCVEWMVAWQAQGMVTCQAELMGAGA